RQKRRGNSRPARRAALCVAQIDYSRHPRPPRCPPRQSGTATRKRTTRRWRARHARVMKFFLLILKNIRRNLVLSGLTSLGTIVLVLVVTLVWSVLAFLDQATAEKQRNLKAIVTERWQIPSQMPFSYAGSLCDGAAREPEDAHPLDSMTWSFYGGTLDIKNRTFENSLFAFVMEPVKLRTMMDDLDTLPSEQAAEWAKVVERLEQNRQGVIVGKDRLALLNKRVGDRIKLYGINYRGIDLEVEIVGVFPPGRYDMNA